MIVNAALAHVFEGVLNRLEEARIAGAQASPPQKLEHRRLRELGRAA